MTTPCGFCHAPLTRELIDLGWQPLANSYLEPTPEAIKAEHHYPLRVMICDVCFLVQLEEKVSASEIFHEDYAYFSSYSSTWVAHAGRYASDMIARFNLDESSLVVEVASNDGYLLQHFAEAHVPSLGVEPAGKCAEAARAKGLKTVVEFFNYDTAVRLAKEGVAADLTVANNVLAHVPEIDEFVAGFPVILKPEGVATFEFPHLLRMILDVQFDTIYHEHYFYLSLGFVERAFLKHGLRIFDVQTLPTHGGSIRLFACRTNACHEETAAVSAIRDAERDAKLDCADGYRDFENKAKGLRDAFRRFIESARSEGKVIGGYGAAAKGNTFLNFCCAGPSEIRFVTDRNREKQGRLLPGSHIPICDPEVLRSERPDLVLILPWNLKSEIMNEHSYVSEWGGKFMVASPQLRIF